MGTTIRPHQTKHQTKALSWRQGLEKGRVKSEWAWEVTFVTDTAGRPVLSLGSRESDWGKTSCESSGMSHLAKKTSHFYLPICTCQKKQNAISTARSGLTQAPPPGITVNVFPYSLASQDFLSPVSRLSIYLV
jgi:hypothetical protein